MSKEISKKELRVLEERKNKIVEKENALKNEISELEVKKKDLLNHIKRLENVVKLEGKRIEEYKDRRKWYEEKLDTLNEKVKKLKQ